LKINLDIVGDHIKLGPDAFANGEVAVTAEYEVGGAANAKRWMHGTGHPIRVPVIDLAEVSAGGGSIAWVDRSGLLQVGPESAGSNPGPVCYGLGNSRPTLTDANVVLGRINAERPIGGKLARLDVAAARAAILRDVGKPLGLDVMAAAEAILRVANANMAGAMRLVSVERGHDPKRFAYMPFGGGPRTCIGDRFAMMEGTLLLARFVQQFRFRYVGEQPPEAKVAVTLAPTGAVPMKLERRTACC